MHRPLARLLATLALASCSSAATPLVFPPDAPLALDPTIEGRVDDLLAQLTLEEKVDQLHGVSLLPRDDMWPTPAVDRLGLPGFNMADGPRGLTVGTATSFPVAMARAASWDVDLERRVGQAIGVETSAAGVDVILAPTINLLRHPAWGRAQETYGEDPFLMGELGVGFVHGAQEHVLASAKHFAANSIEDSRFEVDVQIDERTLREVYLPHFRKVVRQGGVASVMSAYNKVNGLYCAENPHLLSDVLRDDWGFQGFVESDWVLGTRSTIPSLEAGLDIEMPDQKFFGEQLLILARDGVVDVALVDRAARRVIRQKLAFGIDDPQRPDVSVIGSAAHVALAREAAAKGIVLLDNDGLLPLSESSLVTMAVVGQLADTPNTGDVGSSNVTAPYVITPYQGLVDALGGSRVELLDTDTLDASALSVISAVEVAVVVVGLTAIDEGENIPGRAGGDRERLTLSPEQEALITQVAAANPATVVVLQGGSAIVPGAWRNEVAAVVMAWYGGQEGGHALADVLLGAVDPSGRLPLSIPASADDLVPFDATALTVTYGYNHGYRQLDADGIEPVWPFGYGLSYAVHTVSDASAQVVGEGTDAVVKVTFDVASTGPGDVISQVYVSKETSDWARPPQVLVGFARTSFEAAGTQAVTVDVPVRELAVWDDGDEDVPAGFVLERGTYTLSVGRSSRALDTSVDVDL